MTLFITQPTYLPWVGIFKAIDYADTFLFYDDVQFERHSWQNRNRFRGSGAAEPVHLTVPLTKHHRETLIRDIVIANPRFYEEHIRKLRSWYSRAPFLAPTLAVLQGIYSKGHSSLAGLTSGLTMAIAEYIGITCTFRFARDFDIPGDKHTRPLALARALDSTMYLTQAGTRSYTDVPAFEAAGIKVVFLEFPHPVYRQPCAPFTPYLSIVDMLINIGPQESLAVIRSIEFSGEETRVGA